MEADGSDRNVGASAPRKRRYTPPRLEDFGDLRDLTLGGSRGAGESGPTGARKGGPAPVG